MIYRTILSVLTPLISILVLSCSTAHLERYESVEFDRIRVFVTDDLSAIKDEDLDEDAIESRLSGKALFRSQQLLRMYFQQKQINTEQINKYFEDTGNSVRIQKIHDVQNGDIIIAGFDLFYPDISFFIRQSTEIRYVTPEQIQQ